MSPAKTAHFGDPCIYCGTPYDDVAPGPCPSLVWVIANPEAAKGLTEGTMVAVPALSATSLQAREDDARTFREFSYRALRGDMQVLALSLLKELELRWAK